MKKISILGLALFISVSLSSCEDEDEIRPMAVTPAGSFDNPDDEADKRDIFFNKEDDLSEFGDAPDGM